MIVCVCANVSEERVQTALDDCNTLQHVQNTTEACLQCRACKPHILQMIQEKEPMVP